MMMDGMGNKCVTIDVNRVLTASPKGFFFNFQFLFDFLFSILFQNNNMLTHRAVLHLNQELIFLSYKEGYRLFLGLAYSLLSRLRH